jgi:hypothetical protein
VSAKPPCPSVSPPPCGPWPPISAGASSRAGLRQAVLRGTGSLPRSQTVPPLRKNRRRPQSHRLPPCSLVHCWLGFPCPCRYPSPIMIPSLTSDCRRYGPSVHRLEPSRKAVTAPDLSRQSAAAKGRREFPSRSLTGFAKKRSDSACTHKPTVAKALAFRQALAHRNKHRFLKSLKKTRPVAGPARTPRETRGTGAPAPLGFPPDAAVAQG